MLGRKKDFPCRKTVMQFMIARNTDTRPSANTKEVPKIKNKFMISSNSANLIYSISGVILAIGAVMTLLGTIGAIWSGGVRDQYSNERTAANEALTAQANADAAKASEKAALLEMQASAARLELEKLKEKQADWILSDSQRVRLITDLKNAPKGKVEISYTLAEAERAGKFAKVLEGIFREADIPLEQEIGTFGALGAVVGIYINYGSDSDRDRALAYCQAFLNIGIVSKWYKRKPDDETFMPWLVNTVCVEVRNRP